MPPVNSVHVADPSQIFRPEAKYLDKQRDLRMNRSNDEFRNFEVNLQMENVRKTYYDMHRYQTVEFVQQKREKWYKLDHSEMSVMDAVFMLDNIVDTSDPDTDLPNSLHAFQTAESIREKHPDKDWFHLVGLLHDLGKVMAVWGEPQYCVVGDTFPVGCKFQPSIVFHQYFAENPDSNNPLYNSKWGIYSPNCGLDNVLMSWGHDEYMYQVLKRNNACIPEEGMYMIRYHSFYPWHGSGDYSYLCSKKDEEYLPWVLEFNKYDLYSKKDGVPNVDELAPYYQSLIDKYCPGKLKW